MAGITKTQAESMLAEALVNLTAVRTSEAYKVGNAEVKRSMLDAANRDVTKWNNEVIRLSRTKVGVRARRVIPLDG